MKTRMQIGQVVLWFGLCLLSACNEKAPAPTPPPTLAMPTGVAMHPPKVWIDEPLSNQPLALEAGPLDIIVHAASLAGQGQVTIHDQNGQLLDTVALGSPIDSANQGGLLNRYEGQWVVSDATLLATGETTLVLYLRAVVDGEVSEPVILFLLRATPTVTPSPSPTLTATPTLTPSATASVTASITPSSTTVKASATSVAVSFVKKPAIPCEIIPAVDLDVMGRVGPGTNRAILTQLSSSQIYAVTGYNDDDGTLWWEIILAGKAIWVSDEQVNTRGGCMAVGYIDAPLIINQPTVAQTVPTTQGGTVATAIPGGPQPTQPSRPTVVRDTPPPGSTPVPPTAIPTAIPLPTNTPTPIVIIIE